MSQFFYIFIVLGFVFGASALVAFAEEYMEPHYGMQKVAGGCAFISACFFISALIAGVL